MTKTISREEIKRKLDADDAITIVEALPPKYYEAEHLPGAINIPHDQIRDQAGEMLPDKDAFIVVYCSNTACQNSSVASNQLVQMGYTNIHECVEGKQDWLDANLPVEALKAA